MKFLLKWALRLVVLIVALVVIFLLSLDSIIKALVQREIRAQTGMDVKIGRFSFGLLSPVVTIEDFKLYNPPEFGGTPFLDIRELHVEYDREAMARRELHITLLRLSLTELNVVKNDLGGTNLLTFQTKPASGRSPGDEIRFLGIDVLNLSVGKMKFIDLKNRSRDRELYPNLQNQVFKDIKTTGDLYAILIVLWLRSGGGLVSAEPFTDHAKPLHPIHYDLPDLRSIPVGNSC